MTDLLASISALPVLIATIIYFVLGALWYSPLLFAKPWMKIKNIPEDHEGGSPMVFVLSFILQFIGVFSLALFIEGLGGYGALHGALIGFFASTGFVFSLAGATGLFSEVPLKLHLIDNGYHLTGLTLSGLVIGFW
ncbi:MAG: DUF1761 family protein [Bacteroidetes bacterium]|jgi:hypothetical protein|nr:DUF1761 family protein [Bacteroidota bacterium]